jgi:3-hydroxybutyryl-CoA dehydrogenase
MKDNSIKNISVIGSGLMGHGIAQVFASKGYPVYLLDIKQEFLDKGIKNVRANLSLMAKEGLKFDSDIDTIISRIKTTTSMEQATSNVHLVIEAASENLELKQKIFQDLDRLCSADTILATNTSVISISEIAAKAQKRDRIVGTHFWNPPYLIPLVEVVKGNESSDEAVDATYNFLKQAGKHPVKVMKDVPGFIANRLQHALWREAMAIVQNGIADPASVDEVIKAGFGIRLPVLGPMENADMVGLDLIVAIHDYVLKYIDVTQGASPVLKEKVKRGELGFKTGQGFFKWSEEDINKSREKLLKYLIDWTRREQEKPTL